MALHDIAGDGELFSNERKKSRLLQTTILRACTTNAITMAQPSQNDENSLNSQELEAADINDVLQGNIEVSRGQIVRRRRERKPEFTDDENALIITWLEEKYKDLYRRGSSATVADDKREAWEAFTKAVNDVHDGQYHREVEDVFKRVDNMKTNGMK